MAAFAVVGVPHGEPHTVMASRTRASATEDGPFTGRGSAVEHPGGHRRGTLKRLVGVSPAAPLEYVALAVGGQAGSTSQHFSHLPVGPVSASYLLGRPKAPYSQTTRRSTPWLRHATAERTRGAAELQTAPGHRHRVVSAQATGTSIRSTDPVPPRSMDARIEGRVAAIRRRETGSGRVGWGRSRCTSEIRRDPTSTSSR